MAEDTAELQKTVLESIKLADGSSILRIPDIDGIPLYFLSSRQASKHLEPGKPNDLEYPIPDRHDLLESIARTDLLVHGNLNTIQQERIVYAMDELKLPALLAVHLALNTDKDLTVLLKPEPSSPKPISLAMNGRPGVGKSFMTSSLSLKEGYGILSFDSMTGHSSTRYKEYILERVPADKIKELGIDETWKLVNEAKAAFGPEKKLQPKTLRQMLDVATDEVLSKPTREILYLCDMPGMPGTYDFGTGRAYGKERPYDVVDLFAWEAGESGILSTHQLTERTMARKLDWARNEVINKNLPLWQKSRDNFLSAVNIKLQTGY